VISGLGVSPMRRRDFITLIGGAAALAARGARAQPADSRIRAQSQSAMSFSATPTSGSAPLTVNFIASAGDAAPSSFYIDFGDGDSGAHGTLTASHTYSASGTYTAALKRVAAAGGATVLVATIIVTGRSTE
jgi:PKD repeat protein